MAQHTDDAIPICTAPHNQDHPVMVPDGQGRAFLAWLDDRFSVGANTIFIQCIDGEGNAIWDDDGVLAVEVELGGYSTLLMVADGSGGGYLVFQDALDGAPVDVFVQHFDSNGNNTWPVPIQLIPEEEDISSRREPCVVSDGAGGIIIGMTDLRGSDWDIWAQRVDLNGNLLWPDSGVPVCLASEHQHSPTAVATDDGGVIFAWVDLRNSTTSDDDLYMQHLDATGAPVWTTNGLVLSGHSSSQSQPRSASDGRGGALFAWSDARSGNNDLYANRVEPISGGLWWGISGATVCDDPDNQFPPHIIGDGHGGAFLAWMDSRDDGYGIRDIYAQHLGNSGTPLWGSTGTAASRIEGYHGDYGLDLVSDGLDGVIVTWSGSPGAGTNATDIIGQRFDSEGYRQWQYEGQVLSSRDGDQIQPVNLLHPDGGIVMAFVSFDNFTDGNIYTSYIDGFGYPGDASASITGVIDRPGDQGGAVILSWAASYRDNLTQGIHDYTIWKRLHQDRAVKVGSSEDARALDSGLPLWKVEDLLRTGWSYVGAQEAAYLDEYAYDAPTYGDTTNDLTILTDYKVIARESGMVFWESEVGTGTSLDNLSPGAPLQLLASAVGADVHLEWLASNDNDEDLAFYNIYREATPGFTPGPENYLASSLEPDHADLQPGAGTWYYRVTAVDVHDNEGEPSNLAQAGGLSGAGDGIGPSVLAISGNWPNPFNPSTKISFDLPEAGRVQLEVFDSSGRLVATLLDEVLNAGRYSEFWHGRDKSGRAVASGMYFARLSDGGGVATQRMMLVK